MPNDARFDRLKHFMECEEGQGVLQGIRKHLLGHTINDVRFVNSAEGITTLLHLSSGEYYAFNDNELSLDTLDEQFSEIFP